MPTKIHPPRPHAGHPKSNRKPSQAPQQAKERRTHKCPTERCTRCGVTLRPGEPAFLWEAKVVCGPCCTRRQAARVAAALAAPHLPAPGDDEFIDRSPWWARAWRGTRDLLCCPLTGAATLLRRRKRRRQQAAVDPLLAHLHRVAHRV
jgi:hypothetical protein